MKRRLRLPRLDRSVFLFAAIAICIQPGVLCAQALRLASAPPAPGDIAVVEISLDAQAGKEPTGLQWELTVEAPGVTFLQEVVSRDSKGPSSGKSLYCGTKTDTPTVKTSVCMLIGGIDPIPAGKIARIRIAGPAQPGTDRVRIKLDHSFAVYKDLRRVDLKPVELTLPLSLQGASTGSKR
jgi:hypothetical protein